MKIFLNIILCLFVSLTYANASNKTIKIATPTDLIPYSFIDNNKQITGLLIDYWKLWAKKTKMDIEFVPSSWDGTLKALKNNTVHLHSGLFKNKKRSEYINYLNKIYKSESNLYIHKKDEDKIRNIKDLNNKTIAVVNSSFYDDYLKKNYPGIKIKRYEKYKDLIDAIEIHGDDAFLNDSLTSWYQLLQSVKFHNFLRLDTFQLNNWFYAGISKNNNNLKDIILEGMNKITNNEMAILEEKWVLDKTLRHFTKIDNINSLTKEERKYLENNPIINLAVVNNWKYMSFVDQKGKLVGLHFDLLKQINTNLDINIKTKIFDSWTKAYQSAKNGQSDGILGLSWSKEREEFFLFSPAYHHIRYNIVVRKDETKIHSVKDFSGRTAITTKNAITNNTIKKLSTNTTIIHAKGKESILKAISNGKADVSLIANIQKPELEKYNLKISKTIFTKDGDIHIGINKNKVELYSILSKGINSITKEQMKILSDAWSQKNREEESIFTDEELKYIKNTPILKIGIEDWKPIIFLNNETKIEGLAGEIIEQVFNISGLKIQLVTNSWINLVNDFKIGKIDILPVAYYTKKRANYGLYSDAYLTNKEFIYVTQNNNNIHSFKDLDGKKIALEKSYETIDIIKEKFPDILIVETENLEDSISKVLSGEVDALFESQIVVEEKLRQLLITNLKSIPQSSIKANAIRILSRKNDFILQSILQKSLYSIPLQEKNRIIANWLSPVKIKKNVNIAFGKGREPYAFDKKYLKGFEHDLVKYILNMNNISINRNVYISLDKINNTFKKDKSLDIAVTVKEKYDDCFYSDTFITFENTVITRAKDNLFINNINDLKTKKIIAFIDAYKFLGKEYNQLFNRENRDQNYTEEEFQEKQVQDFLDNKADIIILDKNIFKWYLKKLSSTSIDEYKFDFIFPQRNPFKVAFRDKHLRNIFNKNLATIKQSGKYQEIIDNYIKSDIEAKIKINSLISRIASKYIVEDNKEELKNVMNIFTSLDYINKIEIFDLDTAVYVSSNTDLIKYTQQNSFYNFSNIPRKVGFIRVYFDENKLKLSSLNSLLIPPLNKFKDLKSYSYINKIYDQFDYINKKYKFSKKEKEFMSKHPNISYSALNFKPMSHITKDKHVGILNDYINIIEERTGLNFVYKKSDSYAEMQVKFNNKTLDLIPNINYSKNLAANYLISKEIFYFRITIITDKNGVFANKIQDLHGKTLSLVKNFPIHRFMKDNFPLIPIIETANIKEALSLVSQNKVYAFIGLSEIAIYNIKEYFPELKIVGITENKFMNNFKIQKEYPELLSIINKVLLHITLKEKQAIRDKWIHAKIDTAVDYSVIYKIIIFFVIILFIISIFMQKLRRVKQKIEEQKNNFETLFNDTSDGLLLIRDEKFIECNDAAMKLLDYKDKKTFLSLNVLEISPEYQPDRESSSEKFKLLIQECLNKNSSKFEWVCIKSTGIHCWFEIVLTKIILNNKIIIHSVLRDITDKKMLETQIKRRNKQLEHSNEELESTIENLQQTQDKLIESEKMASLGGLVAGIAHEINTPVGIGLTGISHLSDSTEKISKKYQDEDMTQEEFEEYLYTSKELSSLIQKNLDKAAQLVSSFKQVAVDQSSEEKRKFNLNKYMNEILSSIHSVTKKTNIKIDIKCPKDININSYPGAFSQVITNLIMNSIIHGFEEKEPGNISIHISQENNQIKLIYKDNGKGIKKENLNKIFDPFFTTNRENGGSGLGLNIIYNIITSTLNGTITCNSKENEGIEFIIKFTV